MLGILEPKLLKVFLNRCLFASECKGGRDKGFGPATTFQEHPSVGRL